jgi:hypothetical protein
MRRRAQVSFNNCLASTLEVEAARVEEACCDAGTENTVCATGVPTACDAKCAVVFGDFYDRCQRVLSAQLSLVQN